VSLLRVAITLCRRAAERSGLMFPIVASGMGRNAEVGSDEGQDGKPTGNSLLWLGLARAMPVAMLIALEQTQDWKVTGSWNDNVPW
jgi:hypothetical protein